ncbi:cytochrome c oxidase assembly factor CtaG [Streptomyces sp. V3I8]|uniref:cytochrome c oxidase assembly protein n=1 Tax=Streptomyces sp. V3I8 TaxID=3042279 RepID=UPI0027840883|nr:cytochrome c oxidase assembly protein [Streptomyces sp. V3I8]MDQ1041101.1 cytochrome c oxidase assembly factor CtaG [Streptomyces sp. V3I8]
MTLAHVHPGGAPGPTAVEWFSVAAALSAAVAYLVAAGRLRRRGDVWPRWRDGAFTAGGAAVAWAAVGGPPAEPFTAHMVQHLAVGMVAPLLLVLARPLTLTLRALAPGAARRGLLVLAHSRPVGLLLCPPVAALLDAGGMWLLYRTGLFASARRQPVTHALVHVHLLTAGLLFTFAVCQLDPVRRRWGLAVRGAVLLAVGAAHGVLARTLYAVPPPGTAFSAADLHAGAQWMYYGGDVVEAALAMVLGAGWYASRGRARPRRRGGGGRPAPGGRAAREPRAAGVSRPAG